MYICKCIYIYELSGMAMAICINIYIYICFDKQDFQLITKATASLCFQLHETYVESLYIYIYIFLRLYSFSQVAGE